MFIPEPKRKKLRPELNRKTTTVCCIVGEEIKERLDRYCKEHKTSITSMVKQMLIYCMKESEEK